MIKKFYESTESTINVLKNAFAIITDEWKLVARNFTLIDEDELKTAVDLINADIDSIKQENEDSIADSLANDPELDIFDDIYVTTEGDNKCLIADCFLLNSTLTKEERIALSYKKDNVAISSIRENGRDVLRIKIIL